LAGAVAQQVSALRWCGRADGGEERKNKVEGARQRRMKE